MQNRNNKALCLDAEWNGRAKCSTCAVRSAVLCADLPEELLERFLYPVSNCHFQSRSQLYEHGKSGEYLYTIRSGMVKLEQSMPNGTMRIVRLLHAGDVVGLEALVGNSYHHTAVAMGEVDVCRISTRTLRDMDKNIPQLHDQLMQRWQNSLDEADDFIVRLSTGSSTARLARLLLKFSALSGDGGFIIPGREDIGAMLGVTTETASRMMAEFKRQGWVHESNGQSTYCDCIQLGQLAMD
ncbi:MAG: Crp/Fnr family transcriptional regulator [Sulfuriferula sp.]|nr:Crp/Fnr family transcriptional regulator [Sulfuriferula sp.]